MSFETPRSTQEGEFAEHILAKAFLFRAKLLFINHEAISRLAPLR